jgi:hypothetical protein
MAIPFTNETPASLQALLHKTIAHIVKSSPPQHVNDPQTHPVEVRTLIHGWKVANQVYRVAGLFASPPPAAAVYVKVFNAGTDAQRARFQKEITATAWAAARGISPPVVYHDVAAGIVATRAMEQTGEELGLDGVQRARLVFEKLRAVSRLTPADGPPAPVYDNIPMLAAFPTAMLDREKLTAEDMEDPRVREAIKVMEEMEGEVQKWATDLRCLSTGDTGEHNVVFARRAGGGDHNTTTTASSSTAPPPAEALLIDWEGACYQDPLSDVVQMGDFCDPDKQRALDIEGWVRDQYVSPADPHALERYRASMALYRAGRFLQNVVGAPWHPADWREDPGRARELARWYGFLGVALEWRE